MTGTTGAPTYATSKTLVATTAARRDFIPGTSNLSLIPRPLPRGGAAARTAGGSSVAESAAAHAPFPLSTGPGRTPAPRRWTRTPAPGRGGGAPGRGCRGAGTARRARSAARTRPGRAPPPGPAAPKRDRPDRSGRGRWRAWFLPPRFPPPARGLAPAGRSPLSHGRARTRAGRGRAPAGHHGRKGRSGRGSHIHPLVVTNGRKGFSPAS